MLQDEIWLYKHQINQQIEYCDIALNTIEYCLNAKEKKVSLVFFCVQGLLTSLANISKLLWTKKKNESPIPTKVAIEFGIDSCFPIIQNQELRNTNDHFNERLEQYFEIKKTKDITCSDWGIGSISKNGESGGFYNPKTIYFRHIDDVKREILFIGRDIEQQQSIKLDCLKEELQKLKEIMHRVYPSF